MMDTVVVKPEGAPDPLSSRFRGWVRELFKREREEQFSREEQLSMVWLGHALITAGVALILLLGFGTQSTGSSMNYFWILEAAIVFFGFVVANTNSKSIVGGIKKAVMAVDRLEAWMERHGDTTKARVQAAVLLLVYAMQFASMVALLMATGGPIDSPFAPMALAIAIFSPFIVNKWWTVGLIIFTTMIFYILFVAIAGFSGEKTRPDPGSYAAVNLFILVLASIMTLKRRDSLSFTLRRTFDVPRDQVWEAWTDQDQVARWFGLGEGGGRPVIEMDVRSGGVWRAALMRSDGTPGLPWSGIYRKVEPPERLVFTVVGRSGRGEEVVTVELEDKDGRTEMVVTQTDDGRYAGLKEGWSAFFDRMSEYLGL
jgi:uncharacterized protein YndB with AHSA1/START domain